MGNISNYIHTLRYLKPVQIYGRMYFNLIKVKPDLRPAPLLRTAKGTWCRSARRKESLKGPVRFQLLNKEHQLNSSRDWNHPELEKLWLYHLHYFDDLNAFDSEKRRHWHHSLFMNWLEANPPAKGNGWEPYPLSLRIVNWIKWVLAGNTLPPELIHSLAVQTRFLRCRLENHILGNHILANAKALVFAGLFFEGPEAEEWLNKGLTILKHQLPEQILADGGHFERSPMYHSIILEDLLDLINLVQVYRNDLISDWKIFRENWQNYVQSMRFWLKVMTHPDGQIALFNDSAFDISCSPAELENYAKSLGLGDVGHTANGPTCLKQSGYVRVQCGEAVLILDAGEIGPEYLPAHAHADTLSYELSLFGKRCIVDSGTSSYEQGIKRQYERSTPAHNTVRLNQSDSSEVWGCFRVARRAKPRNLMVEKINDVFRVACEHDGYEKLPGRPVHYREWSLGEKKLLVKDIVRGSFKEAESRFHFHPNVFLNKFMSGEEGNAVFTSGEKIGWKIRNGKSNFEQSTYHPEFGLNQQNTCLRVIFQGPESQFNLSWDCVA